MILIHGRGASAGIASGPVYVYQRAGGSASSSFTDQDPAEEWERFLSARKAAGSALEKLRDTVNKQHGGEAAMLFDTYLLLVGDDVLAEKVRTSIWEKKMTAEAAVSDAARGYMMLFSEMDDPYMQARSADIREVCGRILAALSGGTAAGIRPPEPCILCTDELLAGEAAELDPSMILGVITAGGRIMGHAALLLRAKGIPAVMETGTIPGSECCGKEVLIDGSSGEAVIDADEETRRRMLSEKEREETERALLEKFRGLENITKDGKRIRVSCNISLPEETGEVLSHEGSGIGLFRSEFLYLGRQDLPSEELQFEAYRKVLSDLRGKRVVIRTADLGSDKQEKYLAIPEAEDSSGELRGLRLCLARPEMFRTQLRALYRASVYGELAIMFPMVTGVREVREARELCEDIQKELEREGKPFRKDVPLGIMIETCEAVSVSGQLAKEADFFSFGTNDLIRDAEKRSSESGCRNVVRLLRTACSHARRNGIRTGICGEMAADPSF
ncbi:MAG: phosphoenolpyruvate--protein phosphotransferase, partial [Lachnospiraceae bacterium]|nr:phosphoenolpyruvate--protein phosphotransferase [Lachnospiraceae bacterium]